MIARTRVESSLREVGERLLEGGPAAVAGPAGVQDTPPAGAPAR